MKKLYTSFILLLLALTAQPSWARWVVSPNVTSRGAWQEGRTYVLESGSNSSQRGKYLMATGMFCTATVDSTTIYMIEPFGQDENTGEDTYVLRNVKYGYLTSSGVGGRSSATPEGAQKFFFHGAKDDATATFNGTTYRFNSDATAATVNSVTFHFLNSAYNPPVMYALVQFGGVSMNWFQQYLDSKASNASVNCNAWNLHEITYEEDKQQDLYDVISDFENKDYEHRYVGGPNPFQVEEAYAEAMMSAYATAKEEVGNDHTQAEWGQYEAALRAAMSAAQQHVRLLTDGYYYIFSANSDYNSAHPSAPAAVYSDNGALKWKAFTEEDSLRCLVKVEMKNKWTANLRCMSDANYIFGPAQADGSGKPVLTTPTPQRGVMVIQVASGMASLQDEESSSSETYFYQNGYTTTSVRNVTTYMWQRAGDGASWKFVSVKDSSLLLRAESQLHQLALNNELSALISTSRNRINQATNLAVSFKSEPLVRDTTQFSSNNKEVREGSFGALLDDDDNTFFHSAWSDDTPLENDYHNLTVSSQNPLPSTLQAYWRRRGGNNENRPTQVEVSVSEDGETFSVVDTLSNPADALPVDISSTEYLSRPITVGEGKKAIRFSVLSTNTVDNNPSGANGRDNYGHPCFSLGRFNLYASAAWEPDPSTSQSAREDMKPLLQALEEAILTAQGAWETHLVKQSDVDALQAALSAVNGAWADSSVITFALSKAQNLIDNSVFGDEVEVGTFPAESKQELLSAMDASRAAAPYYPYTAAQTKEIAGRLSEAIHAFVLSMGKPAEGWYYLESQTTTPQQQSVAKGHIMYLDGYGKGRSVRWGGDAKDANGDARYMWSLVALDTPGAFALQNVGSGLYLSALEGNYSLASVSEKPVAYEFIPLGNGEMGFRCVSTGYSLATWTENGQAVMGYNVEQAGYPTSWHFVGIDRERAMALKTYRAGRAYVVTLPYSTLGAPTAAIADGEPDVAVSCYRLTAATKENGVVSALHFTAIGEDEPMEAGVPFLMTVGEAEDDASGPALVTIDTYLDSENTVLVSKAAVQNGMHGTLSSFITDSLGLGYLDSSDTVRTVPAGKSVMLGEQSGFFMLGEVENLQPGVGDLTLPVEGGSMVGIRTAKFRRNGLVDVTTLDGVTLRRGVKREEALRNLPKGLYLVGKEKKIVK